MNDLGVFVAVTVFMLGLWQLDHAVAPYVWKYKGSKIEVLPFLYLEITRFYCLCFWAIHLGFVFLFGSLYL